MERLILFGTDLVSWAYMNNGDHWGPVQDWDIILADSTNGELLLQLASDKNCPKRGFFLHCLYILVGDYVRVLHGGVGIPSSIETLLAQVSSSSDPVIKTWLERSRYLIAHPGTFDYDFWCNGGFIQKDKLEK